MLKIMIKLVKDQNNKRINKMFVFLRKIIFNFGSLQFSFLIES